VAIGNEPAHGGCRADSNVAQGRYEIMQPGFSGRTSESVKRQSFKFRRQLFDGNLKLFTFSLQPLGGPAITTLAFAREFLATRSMMRAGVRAGSEYEKIS